MVKITKNASVYDESSSDIPQGYGIEQHPRDGWYAYRVPEYPGLTISYLKDEQWLDRVFSSREDALTAIKAEQSLVIQANLIQFFQDVGLYLLKESLYGRVPGVEIKVNMAELPF